MELAEFGFEGISLVDGERIESSLDLADESGDDSGEPEVMLLTDRRVIHLDASSKRRKAAFVSIRDVEVVEVSIQQEGISAFVWAGLAFFVAIMLWRVIDHPIGSVASAVIVAAMGIYLVIDRIMTPGRPVVTFKTGTSEFRADLKSERASSEVYPFINRLFQLKEEECSGSLSRPRHFAPR